MRIRVIASSIAACFFALPAANAATTLIAIGSLSGSFSDLSSQTAGPLENGVAGNLLGGLGSGFAWAGGNTFIATPDRGPNAAAYNAGVADTTSYITRFQTIDFNLQQTPSGGLPYTLTPTLTATTLMSSATPLTYGSGSLGTPALPNGTPALNATNGTNYFTGRSDGFNSALPSSNPNNARLDPEGVRVSADGKSIFVSDEYGPWLVHLDAGGKITERIGPFPGKKSLPKVLAMRRPNRGMESLTITPDGKTLVGLMQNPVDNPDASIRKTSRLNRLVTFDPKTGASKQYAYMIDATSAVVSEIAAVTDHTFIVSERDQLFQGDPKSPSKLKRIYKIDISQATDISDPADGANGKLVNGKTLEQLSDAELKDAGIVAVTKEMVVDLLALPGGYPHDKSEGLAVINDSLIAVSNDDDFGIVPDGKGGITEKRLPGANDVVDYNRVYFIKLDKPLK